MLSLLIRDVELDGRRTDIGVQDGRIVSIGPAPAAALRELEGRGDRLLPGLHDHHVHLSALAAAWSSVDCSGSFEGLRTAEPVDGWIRAVGSRTSPDRAELDAYRADVPVRVQHRSGAAWSLNSVALDQVARQLDRSADVERDEHGRLTGRLYRYDQRLREIVGGSGPRLEPVVRRLHQYGVTSVTDATPDLDDETAIRLATVPGLSVTLLGAATGTRKLLLRDHDLPTFDHLRATVAALHSECRPVAVHCVTRESLLLTLAALDDVGTVTGDRIEHASVVPFGVEHRIADLGVAVVTQPSFLRLRGDDYRATVAADDLACLYPYARLLAAGVPVAPSSDAPYGSLDPWETINDAAQRRTASGVVLGEAEAVPEHVALGGFLSAAATPGRGARAVVVGAPADLCLLPAGATRPRAVVVTGVQQDLADEIS